jgi:hypothetical protein
MDDRIQVKRVRIDDEIFIEVRLGNTRHMITPRQADNLIKDLMGSLWGIFITPEDKDGK